MKKKKCFICKKSASRSILPLCLECRTKYFFRASGKPILGPERTRMLVRIRDKFKCRKCGTEKKGKRSLDIHHLGGLCGKKSRGYDKVSTISKLITLCHKCHFNYSSHSKRFGRRILKPEHVAQIKELRNEGKSFDAIARVFGVSSAGIYKFFKKNTDCA